MKARLYEKYVSEVVPALKEKRKYTNIHQVPRMEKIVVNMGISASLEKSAVDDAAKDLALITGRKAAISKSRHSISNFKLREGKPIGCHEIGDAVPGLADGRLATGYQSEVLR